MFSDAERKNRKFYFTRYIIASNMVKFFYQETNVRCKRVVNVRT